MTRLSIPVVVLSILAASLAGCSSESSANGGKEAKGAGASAGGRKMPVEVTVVDAREVRYEIAAVGSLEASEVVSVTARVSGVAERVSFREGDRVQPDQVLVEIEPQRFRLAVSQASANSARAEATAREASSALAKREQLRAKDPGWVSAEELETLASRLDVAKAEVAQARAAGELAELNQRDALVRAGTSGAIQSRSVQPGQYVNPGDVLAILVRTDPLYLRFQVSENEAVNLSTGMPVDFSIRATPGEPRHAELVYVADTADPKTRRVECLAEVKGDVAGGDLRPGSFAEVTIATGSSGLVPVIPEGAIRPTERGFVVYVVKDEKAEERTIETGLRTHDGGVEVRSGLAQGELLVTRGAHYLRNGANVEVKEAAPTAAPPGTATPAPVPAKG